MNVVGLLLAAGSASRFGSDKLRHPLPHGVPIAVQAARHLRAELSRVVVVIRSTDAREAFAAERCETVDRAYSWNCVSVIAVRAAGRADAYVVALADMPYVRPATIAAVREALEHGAGLAAPYFRARRGHPVGIAGAYYEELVSLRGDEGARHLLSANEARLVKIPVGDPGVVRDIDRPEDLAPPIRT